MLPYSVLMNRITRGFYPFRKFTEIEFDDSSVVQLLPCGIGHSGLPAGVTRKRGVPGYCASARITLARSSKLVRFTELAGRIISNETDPKECGLEVCYEIAHLGVGSRPDWMGLLRVRLDVSSSFATQRSKDAAEIAAREIMFENHDDPDIARKVQIEMNDFLQGVSSNAG